jgi:hypothetical protein
MSSVLNSLAVSAEQQDTSRLVDQLLGATVADRYLDFCRLSAGDTGLRVSRPLAAHALRELDSMIRRSLEVPFELKDAETAEPPPRLQQAHEALLHLGYEERATLRALRELTPQTTHEAQIRKIIARLGLDPQGATAKAWVNLCGTYGRAHERSFHRSLSVDDEFRSKFQRPFDSVIRAIAVALRTRYSALLQRVEELASMSDIAQAVSLYEKEIPGALPLQWHFFRCLKTADWLPHLINRNLVGECLSGAGPRTDGEIRLGQWPAGDYLLRMAQSSDSVTRQYVVTIIRQCASSSSPDIRRSGFEILAALPATESAPLANIAAGWLDAEDHAMLLTAPERFLMNMTEAKEAEGALLVARSLFRISDRDGEIATLYGRHMYEYSLPRMIGALTVCCGLDALALFCDLLAEAARISKHYGPGASADYSDMTSHRVSDDHAVKYDLYSALIFAVRQASETLAAADATGMRAVMGILATYQLKIFRRIVLHVLAKNPAGAPEIAEALLTDAELIESHNPRLEYAELALAGFPFLRPEARQKLLRAVDSVPDRYRGAWKHRFQEHYGKPPAPVDEQTYEAITIRDLVWHWRAVLPAERQATLATTVAQFGDPDAWRMPPWGQPDESPLADISNCPVDEIVAALESWRPSEDHPKQTVIALAQQLRVTAERDPEKFASAADRLAQARPVYLRAVVEGLRDATRNRKQMPWPQVLSLVGSIFERIDTPIDETALVAGDDRTWLPACLTASEWLRAVLQRAPEGIGYEHASVLRSLTLSLLHRAPRSPEPEDFEEDFARDPFFASQRTLRGSATELCILLTFWYSKQSESDVAQQPRQAFAVLTEISAALATELNDLSSAGRVPRAVMGRYLCWTYYFGADWLTGHVAQMFPQSHEALREAAWTGHLLHDQQPLLTLLPDLQSSYEAEISLLSLASDGKEENLRQQRIGEYLLSLYLEGSDASRVRILLEQFWAIASPQVRRHVVWCLGQNLRLTSAQFPDVVRERALAYWSIRLAAAETSSSPDQFREELSAIGQWCTYEQIDASWLLDQLSKMLRAGYVSDNAYSILDWLSTICPLHVDRAVDVLSALLTSNLIDKYVYFTQPDAIRNVLTQGKARGVPQTLERVDHLVSYLASHGVTAFLDLSS